MKPERCARLVVTLLVLCVFAADADSQGKRGRGRGRPAAGRGSTRPDFLPPETAPTGPPAPIFLPGFGPAGKGAKKGKAPAPGAAQKKPAAKEPPLPPPDPMKAADDVTAAAEHRAQVEEAQRRLLREHFALCDLDGNGWLSLRESEITLSFDRAEYRRADADADGRLTPEEFEAQQSFVLARLGAAPALVPDMSGTAESGTAESGITETGTAETPPTPEASATANEIGVEAVAEPAVTDAGAEPAGTPAPTPPRARLRPPGAGLEELSVKPGDLLERYDTDRSKGIDAVEIGELFRAAELTLSAELVVAQMDANDSGQLEARELVGIAWMAAEHLPAAAPATASGDEGAPAPGTAAPEIRAATHFGRLDSDRDGFVDEADLRALQKPMPLEVRLTALLSALDRDGDGRLSESEFRASMVAGSR